MSTINVEFYKGNGVQSVLRRYDFTPKEKQLLQSAIITARQIHPDMALLEQADVLLKLTTKTKKAKDEDVDSDETARAIAKATLKSKKKQNPLTKQREPYIAQRWAYGFLISAIFYAIFNYVMDHYGKYTFKEAQEICQAKGKVLPLTHGDFYKSNYQIGKVGQFWIANGEVMFPAVGRSFLPENPYGYSVMCIETNGKSMY